MSSCCTFGGSGVAFITLLVLLQVTKRICKGNYQIPSNWSSISAGCRDFIKRCLTVKPSRRITIEEIYQQFWFCQGLPQGVCCIPSCSSKYVFFGPCQLGWVNIPWWQKTLLFNMFTFKEGAAYLAKTLLWRISVYTSQAWSNNHTDRPNGKQGQSKSPPRDEFHSYPKSSWNKLFAGETDEQDMSWPLQYHARVYLGDTKSYSQSSWSAYFLEF